MKGWRSLARELTPPLLLRSLRPPRAGAIGFAGRYRDWNSALAASHGYDSEAIFERTREAALKVARGEAAYERDSVLFDRVEYSFAVIAALLRCALADSGRLRVLDFGGSFGTSYRQFKAFQPPVCELHWSVVEQPRNAECGRREFENSELRFFDSIAAAVSHAQPNAVLLSGVLQYLEDPRGVLREIAARTSAALIVDRTYCSASAEDALTVQVVPPSIYDASYPCWILSRSRLLEPLARDYELIAQFEDKSHAWSGPDGAFDLAGFVLDRRS